MSRLAENESNHHERVSRIRLLKAMSETIQEMPEHSRPRKKLREKGAASLTDEELVAAILGMGTAGIDVRTLVYSHSDRTFALCGIVLFSPVPRSGVQS